MPKVTFVKEKVEIEVPEGANLRQAARAAGIQIYQGLDRFLNCRGLGLCGTCRVLVKKGMENLSPKGMSKEKWEEYQKKLKEGTVNGVPKTLRERFTLAKSLAVIGHEDEMRLSCQVDVHGDCTIETRPEFNWCGENFWQKPYPNK
ncbi:MAG TPA: 2Fe-2S iron-sulfur cluster-binding protein [Gemmataceae bacterium]|nr:2Fe-2S iron-sulfur cluster-binding protein [Gemmataceae bacterium]